MDVNIYKGVYCDHEKFITNNTNAAKWLHLFWISHHLTPNVINHDILDVTKMRT